MPQNFPLGSAGEPCLEHRLDTLTCVIGRDPDPAWVVDETWTQVVVTLAPEAFDGAARSVEGDASCVISERSFAGETIDETLVGAFVTDAGQDPLVQDVRIWHRVHVLGGPTRYERVDISGVVSVDAAGGHVHLTWGEPSSSPGPGRADSIDTAL